jgi:hypothetical protein
MFLRSISCVLVFIIELLCCWAAAVYVFFRNCLATAEDETSELESVDGKKCHTLLEEIFILKSTGIAFEKVSSVSTRAKFKAFLSIGLEKCFDPNLASNTCIVLFVVHHIMVLLKVANGFGAGGSEDDYKLLVEACGGILHKTLFGEQKHCKSYKYRDTAEPFEIITFSLRLVTGLLYFVAFVITVHAMQ